MTNTPIAAKLATELRDLIKHYVNLLEIGRDRIVELGGDCDPVDVMERSDPHLVVARRALAEYDTAKDSPAGERWRPVHGEFLVVAHGGKEFCEAIVCDNEDAVGAAVTALKASKIEHKECTCYVLQPPHAAPEEG